jgi:hypothetical protein
MGKWGKQKTSQNNKGTRSKGKGHGCRDQNQLFRNFKKRSPNVVPFLQYGPSNNFMKFKEALSKKALEEYGALGKLIKTGEDRRTIEELDRAEINIQDIFDRVAYLEEMKQYIKKKRQI